MNFHNIPIVIDASAGEASDKEQELAAAADVRGDEHFDFLAAQKCSNSCGPHSNVQRNAVIRIFRAIFQSIRMLRLFLAVIHSNCHIL